MRLRGGDPDSAPSGSGGGLPLGSGAAAILAPLLDPAASLPAPLDFPIASVCAPERPEPGCLVCVGSRVRLSVRAGWADPGTLRPALIVAEPGIALDSIGVPVLRVVSAHAALAALLSAWSDRWERDIPFATGGGNRIAPTAAVAGCLEGGVEVGPGAYIAAGAFVGRGTRIGANAVIEAHVRIGRDCIIQPGAVIGCAGFGFYPLPRASGISAPPEGNSATSRPVAAGPGLAPMPHPAGVVIGDECFIGANTVIAAGVLHPTFLGKGCKLDSHVQIAHNVVLGDGCLLASQSGVAGSTQAGHRLRMGGAASIDGHLRLGNDVTVAACSGVTRDWPDGSTVAGFPARSIGEWRRAQARSVGERRRIRPPRAVVEILEGPGVHSGIPCRLAIRRLDGNLETEFRFPGFPGPLKASGLIGLTRSARRATRLEWRGKGSPSAESGAAFIGTPEHLLAALLCLDGVSFAIEADAEELPGLDGSALPYRDALCRLASEAARHPRWREYPCTLDWEDRWEGGYLRIRPAERFSAAYEVARGPLHASFRICDARTAWKDVLPARSFIFHEEWRAALRAGLMAGAGPESGLLLASGETEHRDLLAAHPEWPGGPFPLLHPSAWRTPDEPAKHKLLDLLGDLALNGLALPRAAIEIRNGGHAAHHRLLARLAEC